MLIGTGANLGILFIEMMSYFNFFDKSYLEHSFYASKFDGFTVFTNV